MIVEITIRPFLRFDGRNLCLFVALERVAPFRLAHHHKIVKRFPLRPKNASALVHRREVLIVERCRGLLGVRVVVIVEQLRPLFPKIHRRRPFDD